MKTAPDEGASAFAPPPAPRHTPGMLRLALCLLLISAAALHPQQAEEKPRMLETLLLMPEPKALRTPFSIIPAGARETVLTPYHETAGSQASLEAYRLESFAKIGLSAETFMQRAKTAADRRLLQLKPDLIKGDDGKIAYAVYRGESPLYATLLVAPSLPKIFKELFGAEIWVAMPDRHALYVFPASRELLHNYAEDLADRYLSDAFAASCEIFSIKAGEEPRVVAAFVEPE